MKTETKNTILTVLRADAARMQRELEQLAQQHRHVAGELDIINKTIDELEHEECEAEPEGEGSET